MPRRATGYRWAGGVVTAVLLAACGSDGRLDAEATTSPVSTTTPIVSPTGLASDEPCTRTVAPGRRPTTVSLRGDDLERMVPTREELGEPVVGFERDGVTNGYHDNAELQMIEVNDPAHSCDDLAEFGRVSGYGTGLTSPPEERRRVVVSVHLFIDEPGAAGWVDVFIDRFRSQVGPGRVDEFQATPSDALGPGGFILRHVGPEGTRDWALLRRGPVVGSVVDVHHAAGGTIDVTAAAKALGDRIDAVRAEVGQRTTEAGGDLDLAAVKSALVPRAELGERFSELAWDSFFGGCADAFEREAVADADELDDVRRFRRVTGCTAMYAPSEQAMTKGDPGSVERVFTTLHVFADPDGASGYLGDTATELEGGRAFDIEAIGDETAAASAPGREGGAPHTRVLFRVGRHVGIAALQEQTDDDRRSEVERIARRFHERLTHLLAGEAP